MMLIAHALSELQRGFYVLLNGFPSWLAAVHLSSARKYLRDAEAAVPPHLGERTLLRAWKFTDDLADAVRELPGNVPTFCSCIDNREARHQHTPLGCVVIGCGCRATTNDGG